MLNNTRFYKIYKLFLVQHDKKLCFLECENILKGNIKKHLKN